MKKLKIKIAAVATFALFMACNSDDDKSTQPVDDGPIISTLFENDADGWKIVGDAQGGYMEPVYFPDGGVIGGYIFAEDDVAGGVWYFSAPQSYRGNKLEYYGSTLQFSLFQDSDMSNQFASGDVIFQNGDLVISYVHNSQDYPTIDWTSYSVPIEPGPKWFKGAYNSGVLATEADMKAVLSHVTEFRIRGEFETGPDSGGLDKVIIGH